MNHLSLAPFCLPLLFLLGCSPDPRTDRSPLAEELLELERFAARDVLQYLDLSHASTIDPEGAYLEARHGGDLLWVWSTRQPEQRGFKRSAAGRWEAVAARRGPLQTRRCEVGTGAWEGLTLCLGEAEPGGLKGWRQVHQVLDLPPAGQEGSQDQGKEITPVLRALPARAGFRDLALHPTQKRLYVLDGVEHKMLVLDDQGNPMGAVELPPSARRIGLLGSSALFALSAAAPQLILVPLDSRGDVGPKTVALKREAPIRDAAYDSARALLWTVGPEDARVRRDRGPIEHLSTWLVAYDVAKLLEGRFQTQAHFDLGAPPPLGPGLSDATAVLVTADGVVVSASGSDRLWMTRTPSGPGVLLPAGLHPRGGVALPGGFAMANRLDDSLWIYAASTPASPQQQLVLGEQARRSPRDLGERLFYSDRLWKLPGAPYTCNSCHWDTGSDQRLQPGFEEQRWELTRPLAGLGAVSPIFSPGHGKSLSAAIEGLIRGLDGRFWKPPWRPGRWWLESRTVPIKGGDQLELTPLELRQALLEFLLSLPRPPGPLRGLGQPFSARAQQGWDLFARDCLSCHEATLDMRSRARVPTGEVLEVLRHRPLTLGAPLWSRSGALPYFTPRGNRIPPLVELGRAGPFFSHAREASLAGLLRNVRPGTPEIHLGGALTLEDERRWAARSAPVRYSEQEVQALQAFLLEL